MSKSPHPRCKLCRQNHPLGQCPQAPGREIIIEAVKAAQEYNTPPFIPTPLENPEFWKDYLIQNGSRGGRASAASLTPQERSERARRAAQKRWSRREEADDSR